MACHFRPMDIVDRVDRVDIVDTYVHLVDFA
jgi:hypothetical protein